MAASELSMSASVKASLLAAMEGIEQGAVAAGLPSDTALLLAGQTLKGSTLVLMREDSSPALLKDRVTSPGGTTIAGLAVLEERGVRGALMRAVQRATSEGNEK